MVGPGVPNVNRRQFSGDDWVCHPQKVIRYAPFSASNKPTFAGPGNCDHNDLDKVPGMLD